MQGQVLQADAATQSGIILGDDGNRYQFAFAEWRAAGQPAAGLIVDFLAAEGTAREIFPLATVNQRPTPSVVVQPSEGNSVLLGGLGLGSLALGFVIPVIPTIAAFVLGLIGADDAKRHKNATGLLLSRIAWIGALALMLVGILLLAFGFAVMRDVLGMMMRDFPFDEFFRRWNEIDV